MGPSQPMYLQSDMHLQSDTLSSALRGSLYRTVTRDECLFWSEQSKHYLYEAKHFLFPVTLTTLIFLGLRFLEMFWDIQYSNFRFF